MAKDEGKSSLNSTTKVKKKRITVLFIAYYTTLYMKGERAQDHVDIFSQKCVSLNKRYLSLRISLFVGKTRIWLGESNNS